jgi:hypothetical protein
MGKIFLFILLIFCAPKKEPQNQLPRPNTQPEHQSFLKLIDISQSQIAVRVQLSPSYRFGPKLMVPKIEIRFQDTSYVQILRCDKDYRDFFQKQLDLKWAWRNALGNPSFCRIISMKTQDLFFEDFSAKKGSFFYILNPCLTPDQSKNRQDECSFDLKLTETITFEFDLSQAIEAKSLLLLEIESQYQDLLDQLRFLTFQFLDQKDLCDQTWTQSQADHNRDKLLTSVGTLAGAALAGTFFLGGRSVLLKKKTSKGLVLGTGGFFSLVGAAFLALDHFVLDKGPKETNACQTMKTLSEKILVFEKEGILEKKEIELMKIQKEMKELYEKIL